MQSHTATDGGAHSNPPLSLSSADILASLEDDVDVVTWINDVIESSDETNKDQDASEHLVDMDRKVTYLIGALDLATEDTSSQVERIIDDISRGASRLTYDLHFMRDGALSLQGMLKDVETRSKSSISSSISSALDQLHLLDTMKRNMVAAREVLREAESWGALESDVTSLLREQNYEKAAERLNEANKSMVVFQNTPEFESRRTLMISLQNQLEASLSSALVAAVNSQDVVVCKNYFNIFCNIQRESEFRNYYYGSRRKPLTEMWQSTSLTDCDSASGASNESLIQFLPKFYSIFTSVLQNERTSIPAIFPDPQQTLATLITSTLSVLQPTFSQRLSSLSSSYGSSTLRELISVYRATEDFAVAVDKVFEKMGLSAAISPDPDATPPKPHLRRRSSARMSISGRLPPRVSLNNSNTAGSFIQLDWDQDLFEPFVDFQSDYAGLEKRLLLDQLQQIVSDGQNVPDKSRLLRERSVDVFSVAEEAVTRCLAFTRGYGLIGLISSLNALLVKFAEISKADFGARKVIAGEAMTSAGSDLFDLDYTPEDWSEMQALLHFLEAVRALRDRIVTFETKLKGTLSQVAITLRAIRQDPLGAEVSGTTRGAIQLLTQSTLNSLELQSLLDQIENESRPQSRDPYLAPHTTPNDPRRSPQTHPAQLPTTTPLLVDARAAISNLASACQVALQDTILRPLRKRLSSYSSSSQWSSQGESKSRRGGNALSDIQIPTFSLSPSDTMQRVAEGLLNLPRLFEVYADDDALSFSLETLPFIRSELLKSLAEPLPTPNSAGPTGGGVTHTRRSPSLSLKATPPTTTNHSQSISITEFSPEAVSAVWLSSLSLSLLSHLTTEVLPSIRTLSSQGSSQLSSDLGYLSSIVMALNVEYEDLDKWKEFVELDDVGGRAKVKENPELKNDNVFVTVAKLRGWSLS
ncbi:Conserved oligomeric Golgi complex subunit 7 [Abortiporus biennis]